MKEYQNHPLAEIFPMMGKEEIAKLAADIKEHGLQNPIVLYEGKILDGRNRYLACGIAGVGVEYEEYPGKDPHGYIVSLNLHRRHLSESQRAIVGAKIADMQSGERTDLPSWQSSANLRKINQTQAAELLNVSPRSIQTAKKIMREAPEQVPAIERGEKTINKAMREIKAEQPPKPKIQIHPSVTIDKEREKALRTANNAINELRKIPVNNETRREAFLTVKKWIIDNI